MIVVKLMGGLGNQMFQYAAGRALAHHCQTSLTLDLSFLYDNTPKENVIPRSYGLDIFNINGKKIFFNPVKKSRFPGLNLLLKAPKLFTESHFHFDPTFFTLKNNTYLEGFWQSHKYFLQIDSLIAREFSFKRKTDPVNQKVLKEISNSNAVSIHVRRGDYVNNAYTNAYHGTCTLDYYRRAVRIISEKVQNPIFFVFSDDIEWTQTHLTFMKSVFFVGHNQDDNYWEDLRLMTFCKHNIIANSTFSWWGAWLNRNPEKIVIAPEKWFNNSGNDPKDLIPESWIKI